MIIMAMHSFLHGQVQNPDGSIWLNSWSSCDKTENPIPSLGKTHWIKYDLGSIRFLSRTWVWNSNEPGKLNQGMKKVRIDYSEDGQEWTQWGEMEWPKGNGKAVYSGFPGPDMVGLKAKEILITAIDNHGHSQCFGFSEIKFNLLPDTTNSSPGEGGGVCEKIKEFDVYAYVNEAFVEWEFVEDAEYRFFYRKKGLQNWQELQPEEAEVFMEDLDPDTEYEFYVEILCEDEWIASDVQSFKTVPEGACEEYEDISVMNITSSEARIEWTIDQTNVPYDVILTTEDGYDEEVFNTSNKYFEFTQLLPNTEYIAYVMHQCEGATWYSDEVYFRTEPLTTSTDPALAQTFQIDILPNPSDGRFNLLIRTSKPDILNIRIYDLGGQTIYRNVVMANSLKKDIAVDIGQVPEGTYLIKTLSLETRTHIIKKVIIAK